MIKIIAVLVSAIFFFGFGDELALAIKKTSILKVHQGLTALSGFTQKMTFKKGHR